MNKKILWRATLWMSVFTLCASFIFYHVETRLKEKNKPLQISSNDEDVGGVIRKSRSLKEDINVQKAGFYFSLGELASEKGDLKEATEYFKKALKLDPDSSYLNTRLGEEYLKRSEFEIATTYLKKAIELNPQELNAHLLLGGIYTATKEYKKAEDHYTKAIKLNPENEKTYIFLATLYSEEKKYDNAIQTLQKLLKIEPQSFLAYYYLGQVYSEKGQMSKAISNYKKSLEINPSFQSAAIALGLYYETKDNVDKAIDIYMGVLEKGSSNVRLLRRAVQLLLAKKDYARALRLLEDLKYQDPQDVNNRVRIGLIYYEIGQYEKSKLEFEELLKQYPDSDRIHYYLSATYEKLNLFSKAMEELKQVPDSSSFYVDAVSRQAYLLREEKRYKEALEIIKHALQKYPLQNQFYDLMASVYEREEKYDEAAKILREGVQKFPKEERILYYLGAIYDKQGDFERAISVMQDILKINPNNADALNFMGYTYVSHNMKLDEAEKLIQAALKLKPGEGYIEDSLGWMYYLRGNYKKARSILEKAVSMKPDEPVILDHLGDVYMKLGDLAKAYEFYQKAAQANPANVDKKIVDSIKQKIENLSQEEIIKKRFPATNK